MLYHLFKYLDEAYDLPGSGMFQYISFRAAAAIILSLLIVIIFGRRIIDFLRRKQIGSCAASRSARRSATSDSRVSSRKRAPRRWAE